MRLSAGLALSLLTATACSKPSYTELHPEVLASSGPVSAPPEPRPPVGPRPAPLVVATEAPDLPPSREPDPQTCTLRLPARLGADCRFVLPVTTRGTTRDADSGRAVDGDTCTLWNAEGFAPQALTIDLGAPTDVDAFVLVPEMSPSGQVTHRIELSDDGRTFVPAHRIEGPMRSEQAFEMVLPRRERTRFVRVRSEASPSWIAWREVGVVRCGASAR